MALEAEAWQHQPVHQQQSLNQPRDRRIRAKIPLRVLAFNESSHFFISPFLRMFEITGHSIN